MIRIPTLGGRQLVLVACALLVLRVVFVGIPERHEHAARIALALGHLDTAEQQLDRATRLQASRANGRVERADFERAGLDRTAAPGARDPMAELRLADDWLRLARVHAVEGRGADAERCLRRAMALQSALPPGGPAPIARLAATAMVLHELGHLGDAETLYERALERSEPREAKAPVPFAALLDALATLRRDQGRLAEAESLYRRALAIRQRVLPPEDPQVADSLYGLGTVLHDRGATLGAEVYLSRAASIVDTRMQRGRTGLRAWLGLASAAPSRDVALLIDVWDALASLYIQQGRFDEAEGLLERALALADDAELVAGRAPILGNLASLDYRRGRYAKAERRLREALRIVEERLPAHPVRARFLAELSSVELALGRYDEARSDLERAIRIVRQRLPVGHPAVARLQEDLERLNRSSAVGPT